MVEGGDGGGGWGGGDGYFPNLWIPSHAALLFLATPLPRCSVFLSQGPTNNIVKGLGPSAGARDITVDHFRGQRPGPVVNYFLVQSGQCFHGCSWIFTTFCVPCLEADAALGLC